MIAGIILFQFEGHQFPIVFEKVRPEGGGDEIVVHVYFGHF